MSLSVCNDFKITACYIIDISIIMLNSYRANVAKLVDALVLGTSWLPSGSSSLPIRTTQIYKSSRLILSFSILSSHRPAGIQKYLFKIV